MCPWGPGRVISTPGVLARSFSNFPTWIPATGNNPGHQPPSGLRQCLSLATGGSAQLLLSAPTGPEEPEMQGLSHRTSVSGGLKGTWMHTGPGVPGIQLNPLTLPPPHRIVGCWLGGDTENAKNPIINSGDWLRVTTRKSTHADHLLHHTEEGCTEWATQRWQWNSLWARCGPRCPLFCLHAIRKTELKVNIF